MSKKLDIEKLNGKIIICSYRGIDMHFLILHEEENPDAFFRHENISNNDYSFLAYDIENKQIIYFSRSQECINALLTKGIYYYKGETNDPDDDMVDTLV